MKEASLEPDSHKNTDAEEALLARLLDELTRALRAGDDVDIERAAAEHPEIADELRHLWGAVVVTEELARSSVSEDGSTLPRATLAAAAPVDLRGQTFGGHEILRELGRGGMGVVYEARQKSLDRRVALKILLGGELARDSDTARFRAEAESAAHLDHPNITPVFDVGEAEGIPFFTMRLIDGTTLMERLRGGPLAPREAAELLLPVCHAIHYAHQRGVLHRDLKPSNILIDEDGVPYVSDFGLAKRIDLDQSLTLTGAIIGTPGYMAPEQASGGRGEIGPASDVYSIGAVLYHALTGRPPFQDASPVDTVLSVLEKDPLPPRLLNGAVDRDLEMIVLKALQKPTELRYASAEALARDLEAYLAGDPVSVRDISLPLLFTRMFRETHHASILENWGLLWMWHSVVLVVLCVATNAFQWMDYESPLPYIALWGLGFSGWALIFWTLRQRSGPITFVERQIAHIWAASVLSSTGLFFIEMLLDLPVLTLSPVLGLIGATVFVAKAGILSGKFYIQAAALFLTSGLMALVPKYAQSIFGVVSAACFFFPGLKYYRLTRGTRPR